MGKRADVQILCASLRLLRVTLCNCILKDYTMHHGEEVTAILTFFNLLKRILFAKS